MFPVYSCNQQVDLSPRLLHTPRKIAWWQLSNRRPFGKLDIVAILLPLLRRKWYFMLTSMIYREYMRHHPGLDILFAGNPAFTQAAHLLQLHARFFPLLNLRVVIDSSIHVTCARHNKQGVVCYKRNRRRRSMERRRRDRRRWPKAA